MIPAAAERLTSEDAFLVLIDRFFPAAHKGLLLGRGDDAAVLACPSSLCVSTDLFLENVHFRRSYFLPADIGHKALAVNISDIAAMGANPLGFAVNLMVAPHTDDAFWSGFFTGMAALADEYGLYLAGGDLSRSTCLGVAVTIWGEQVPAGRFLQRAQGKAGDVLFIIGDIGLARTGLAVLEHHPDLVAAYPHAVQAHLRPAPLVAQAQRLAVLPAIRGLMDVSDGLIRDLPRFLGAHLGCRLSLIAHDLHPEVVRFAHSQANDPTTWALLGGEDYALLGAVNREQWPAVQRAIPNAQTLGLITNDPGIYCNGDLLEIKGFDHFHGG